MIKANILLIFSIAMVALCIGLIIFNFVIRFKGSDSGAKNVIALVSGITGSITGFVNIGYYFDIKGLIMELEYFGENSPDYVAKLQKLLDLTAKRASIFFAIGAVSLIILIVLLFNFKKEREQKYANNKKRWNL